MALDHTLDRVADAAPQSVARLDDGPAGSAPNASPPDSATDSKTRFAHLPVADDRTVAFDHSLYTAEEHDRWNRLAARCKDVLRHRACDEYLAAMDALDLSGAGIPDAEKLSDELEQRTGWRVVPVAGYVPDKIFFEHLANKRFPIGVFIRPEHEFDYLEEPDIFHDVFGHVPLLTNPAYAAFSHAYGKARTKAAEHNCITELLNLYWFTIEFGLVKSDDGLKLFGAGLMSSAAEAKFALDDPSPNRLGFDLERAMRTNAFIDDYQQTYFVIDSFNDLLDICEQNFTPIYERLADNVRYEPGAVLSSDDVIHRGTQAYFQNGKHADRV